MKIIIEPYNALPCDLEVFTINDVNADKEDFGETESFSDDDYGCVNNHFVADYTLKDEAMKKYNITEDEFDEICEKLEDILYVGSCGWCK